MPPVRLAARVWLAASSIVLVVILASPALAASKPFDLNGHDWEGCADFVQLAAEELGTRAYPTSTVELSTLQPEDALILIHPERALDIPSLAAFLRAGGRVVLLDDFGRGDALLTRFDIQRGPLPSRPAEMLRHNPALPIAEPASVHPLTTGVGRVVLNHATAVTNPELSPILVVHGQGEPDAIVAVSGVVSKGRLFAVGDASIVINAMLRYPGNKALAKNLLAYAANADAPDRKGGRVYLLSGAFDLRGSYGGDARTPRAEIGRALREAYDSIRQNGLPPFASYFLSVCLGLGIVLWTGSRAGKVHATVSPRYARPIPLAAQGGIAGHAAVIGGDRTSRALALLEYKNALEEELAILLGLERVPAADVLVAHAIGAHLLDADAGRSLRRLLLRMAKIETMMLAANHDALRRIRDREVLLAAATVAALLATARKNALQRGRAAS